MRCARALLAATVIAVAGIGSAYAIDLNEIGAFLVYPGVEATWDQANTETFLTITSASSRAIIAHVSFIDGDERSPRYCYECDFDVPMSGLDTETLVLTSDGITTTILNLDSGARRSCAQRIGFVTVDVEDSSHRVLTENVLLGSEVVVDYGAGTSFSVPAISVQGVAGDGNRTFLFDGSEYQKFPSAIGTDFLAPDFAGGIDATLVLFTLGFERQFPPLSDCSVIGVDAFESQFSSSFQFGCWTAIQLRDIDPEFAYPFLGDVVEFQEHGWVQLTCTVNGTGTNGVIQGGVHGAITQTAHAGAWLQRNSYGPRIHDAASWARIVYQSGTVGDAMALHLEDPAGGGGF